MTFLKATAIGLGLLALSGCAVYDPYPVYPAYPAYPPSVVVQPRAYGYWGGYWGGGWGGPYHHGGHWGHSGRGHWR